MLGETIRNLRKAKGLTQRQVADEMGVTPPAVTQWEAGGGIDMPNLRKLAKVLGVQSKVLVEALEQDQKPNISDLSDEMLQDSDHRAGNNAQVSNAEEGKNMGDAGGVRDPVLNDILARLRRLEGRVFEAQEPAETKAGPRKGTRGR